MIFLITIFAYFNLIQFERGFANYFGIPEIFISINIFHSFTIFYYVFFIFFICLYISISLSFFQKDLYPNKLILEMTLVIVNLICLSLSIFILFFWEENITSDYFKLIISQFVIQIFFIIVFVIHKLKFNINKKLMKWKNKFCLFLFIALSIINVFFLPFHIGFSIASMKIKFLVIKENPELVVINRYEDYFVCVPFDRKTNTYPPTFKIIKFINNQNIEYKFDKIGRLKLVSQTKN